jgi:AmmeMemoRadiSam system protein B
MSNISELRPSPIAGTWYSSNPKRLRQEVQGYIDRAELPPLDGEIIALISPHAGHKYSGPTAGYAFAAIRGMEPELVSVVSPFHSFHSQPFLMSAHKAYHTPLGSLWIDEGSRQELDAALEKKGGSQLEFISYDNEHSLEIILPFLQIVLTEGYQVLPVMANVKSLEASRTLGLALAEVLSERNALMVASTDLSHFYQEKVANQFDHRMLEAIASFSPEDVFQTQIDGKGFACGIAAVTAVLFAAKELGADRVQILDYSTSGEVTGDRSSVVGYGAAVMLKG